ncbi:hypothetical protein [Prosthecobacter sp.]|uniref:hypothetical protein n=1 Tax=Prosthecobacter sp. TaxID=1965333 RepID=UPI002486FC89|nr:hypothetical protein [Prosthecobacter sp.]MDI1311264.1 hypothetical protein [Prosthecobacter sp.]
MNHGKTSGGHGEVCPFRTFRTSSETPRTKQIPSFKAPDGPAKKDAEIAYQKGEAERSFTWLRANAGQ